MEGMRGSKKERETAGEVDEGKKVVLEEYEGKKERERERD